MTKEMEDAFIKIRQHLIEHQDNTECAEALKHCGSRIEFIGYMIAKYLMVKNEI